LKAISLFLSGDVNEAKKNVEMADENMKFEEKAMLLEDLQGGLDILYQEAILPEERVNVRLQGCMGEALVITDRRVLILKAGYPAGRLFARKYKEFKFPEITSLGYTCGFDKGLVQVVGEVIPEDNDSIERMRHAENVVNFPADKAFKFRKAIELLNGFVDIRRPEQNQQQ
jgi:hypothetical protein